MRMGCQKTESIALCHIDPQMKDTSGLKLIQGHQGHGCPFDWPQCPSHWPFQFFLVVL